jgi:hypothetical protein
MLNLQTFNFSKISSTLVCMDLRFSQRWLWRVTVFWHITPYSPLQVNRRFKEHVVSIFRVEGLAELETRVKTGGNVLSRCFLARLILRPSRWKRYVPPKRRLTFNGLQGDISQQTVDSNSLVVSRGQTDMTILTKTNRLMLFGETIAVYCENHMEHINTLCGQNAETLYIRIHFVPHRKHITSPLQSPTG